MRTATTGSEINLADSCIIVWKDVTAVLHKLKNKITVIRHITGTQEQQ
jgi:hypothetical protein